MNEDFNFSLEEECILFNINEEACHKILKKYCKYFLFKPSSLKKADIYKNIEARYVPISIYDFLVSGNITFNADKILKKWVDKNYKYREVDRFKTKYECSFTYEDILMSRNSGVDSLLISKLEPFDLSKSVKEVDKEKLENDANIAECLDKTKTSIYKDVVKQIKNYDIYDEMSVNENNLQIKEIFKRNILLPIYLYNFTYKNKNYTILINGQTGKIVGDFPISKSKILIVSIIIFLLIFLVSFLIVYLI